MRHQPIPRYSLLPLSHLRIPIPPSTVTTDTPSQTLADTPSISLPSPFSSLLSPAKMVLNFEATTCLRVRSDRICCKRLVLQYTPLILMNGEKFLEKNDICSAVCACQVSKEPSIESVVPEKTSIDA